MLYEKELFLLGIRALFSISAHYSYETISLKNYNNTDYGEFSYNN